MKKFVVFVLILLAGTVSAQKFEGTINWAIKSEVTDPAMKAKMDAAEAKMKDPANQAKMKEMQEKMNDPQMKAMMDANPQLKAQMENMMKMAQGGDLSSMIPSGMVVKMKGAKSVTKIEGGMMPMEILHDNDKNVTYRIDRANKVYNVMAPGTNESNAVAPDVKVTKTSETLKILNYTCTKYVVTATVEGKSMEHLFWTTTEIKDIDVKNLAKQRIGQGGQPVFYEGIEGVPLKMEMQTAEARMTMEVTAIKKEAIPDAVLTIPADFKEVKSMR